MVADWIVIYAVLFVLAAAVVGVSLQRPESTCAGRRRRSPCDGLYVSSTSAEPDHHCWRRSFIGPPKDCCRPDRDRGARLNVRVYSDWPGRQPTIGSNWHGQSGDRRKSSTNGHHQRRSRHGPPILARH